MLRSAYTVLRLIAVYLAVFLLVLAISGLRLSSLTLAGAPRELWLPFVRPLLAATLEMSFLLAAPAGGLVARAAGMRVPFVLLVTAALGAICFAPLRSLEQGKPAGTVAQEILDASRASCAESPERRVRAPLLAVEWTCAPGQAAHVSGMVPFLRSARFSATELTMTPDLRRLSLEELELNGPLRGGGHARLAVHHATIRGFAPWGVPANASSSRSVVGLLLAGVATLAMGLALGARQRLSALPAGLIGGVAGVAPVAVLRSLDRLGATTASYALMVASGPLALLVLWLLVSALSSRFRGRHVAG